MVVTGVFLAVFLQVSPFVQGNLRVGTFLVMLLMLKNGYAYAPYVSLDKLISDKADMVERSLAHNQESLETGRADWSRWLLCFLTLLQDQKDVLDQKLRQPETDLSHLPTLSAGIMALFKDHQRLQMKEILFFTKARRSTVKVRLQELVDQGFLKRHGQARSTWYALV